MINYPFNFQPVTSEIVTAGFTVASNQYARVTPTIVHNCIVTFDGDFGIQMMTFDCNEERSYSATTRDIIVFPVGFIGKLYVFRLSHSCTGRINLNAINLTTSANTEYLVGSGGSSGTSAVWQLTNPSSSVGFTIYGYSTSNIPGHYWLKPGTVVAVDDTFNYAVGSDSKLSLFVEYYTAVS